MSNFYKRPSNLELVNRIVALNLEEGTIVKEGELYALLELPHPRTANDYDSGRRLELNFMKVWTEVCNLLLTQHCLAFKSVGGGNKELVAASDQTAWAREKGQARMETALVQARNRINFVNVSRLDDAGRRERTDALTYFAQVAAVTRQRERRWA